MNQTKARGLSLIELMVAMTISILLLAGMIQIFISAKQGYRIQESTSLLQENARFAMRDLSHYINLADYWGGVEAEAIRLHPDLDTAYAARGNCDFAWAMDLARGVFGYDGDSTPPGPTDCIPTGYVPNSDVVVIRTADPEDYASTAALADSSIDALSDNGGLYLRTLVGASGIIFQRDDLAAAAAAVPGDDDQGILNHRFEIAILYLADFDIGGTDSPTLSMLDLDTVSGQATLRPYQLVEGIEQMQLAYGVDMDADQVVDIWKNATAVTANEWDDVIIVRAGLIVRGRALDDFVDTATYQMPGGFAYTPAIDVARFQRRLIVRDIQVRNRVRE